MMLRKVRILIASLFFFLLTLLFLDFTGTLHAWLGWMAEVQLIPAILAVNAGVLIVLILLTFIFGRLYCSVICPLGIFQDLISSISGVRKGKKNRFRYSRAKSWLRYGVLGLFVIALFAGISSIVSLLDPYAAYGRIASGMFAPLYRWGNNLLAMAAESIGSYAFYSTEVWMKSWITFGVAALTLFIIGLLAWRHGRTYCNTICPVGTTLGLLSKVSIFKPVFNTDKCNSCGLCARNCKSACMDVKSHQVDYSRCVTCFNCIDKCKTGGIKYVPTIPGKINKRQTTGSEAKISDNSNATKDLSRRNLLTLLGTIALSGLAKAQEKHVDGGLATIEDKKIPDRKTSVLPPGASAAQNMKAHCTACQLCVSACPNDVLRPSSRLETFMQPEMSFERGYCRPECVECSQVCPAGAIKPITPADKTAVSIGQAVWIKDNCVVNTDEVQCTNCERHCPTGAITLVSRDPQYSDSLQIPVVDKELCIGCGACENLCPARPFSAIYVEGYIRHHAV